MINAVLGTKKNQTQMFLTDGTRIPVTEISVNDNYVVQNKTASKDGYFAVQLGINRMKNPSKAEMGHSKKGAKLDFAPNFLKEVRMDNMTEESMPELGSKLDLTTVFEAGDIIDVMGRSKGKGFAGVVKRHHFKGGPRTHGQSDRERAPGSLGQTTTPGRVYKNKRMAGKMGFENVTIKNLLVVDVLPNTLLVKGLVPGPKGVNLFVEKKEKAKKFTPLLKNEEVKEVVETPVESTLQEEAK